MSDFRQVTLLQGPGNPVDEGSWQRRSGVRALALTLVAVAALLMPAFSQAASPGPWVLPATELSTGDQASYAKLAFAPDGSATAVWGSVDGVDPTLQAATRPPGGSFGPPVALADVSMEDPQLQISIEPDGTTVVVWRNLYTSSPDRHNIRAAVRPAGATLFSPAFDLSPQDGTDAIWPRIGSGASGTTVIWTLDDGIDTTVQAATRPSGGTFTSPVRISPVLGTAEEAQLAVGPDGTAAAVWIRPMVGWSIIQAASLYPGEADWEPANLSEPIHSYQGMRPGVAVGPDGTVIAVWHLDDEMSVILQAASLAPHDVIWNRVNLTQSGQHAGHPWVEFAPDGTATVVWIRWRENGDFAIQSSTRPPGGGFRPPVTVFDSPEATNEPRLAIGSDGTAAAAWAGEDAGAETARVAVRPAGSSTWTTEAVSGPGAEIEIPPRVVVTGDGSAVALWAISDDRGSLIQTATRPAGGIFTPPVSLSEVDIHTTAPPEIAVAPDGTGIVTSVWGGHDGSHNLVQTASTAVPNLQLKAARAGGGNGTITSQPTGIECGTSCSVGLPAYSEVILTATAAEGSSFTGWSGSCSGSGTTCQVRMDAAKNVTAAFTGPDVPAEPTDTVAIFDGRRLHVRLKCGARYRPKCDISGTPVTARGKQGKPMAKPVKKKIKSGGWARVTFPIKPKYRAVVNAMARKAGKTLYVRQQVRSKKIGKRKFRGRKPLTSYHRYRVRSGT